MRVAVGGLWHETNTFSATPTRLEDFQLLQGDAIVEALAGTGTPIGGFLDAARARGLTVAPTLFASALPSGTVAAQAYAHLLGRLVSGLREARPDAILLDLHGAMVAEGVDDVEGDVLLTIRQELGGLPVGCVMDFHANISAECVELADLLVGYDTYPHVDPYERGIEVATLLARLLAGEIRPVRAHAQPPLLTVPQAQATDRAPMRDLIRLAHTAERRPGVLTVTVAAGFPYADVPFAGLSVVATADGDPGLAGAVAEEVAAAAWTARREFLIRNVPPDEAVASALDLARSGGRGPVVLVDVADNVGGGGPGDGTILLDALLRARAEGAVVTVTDPEVVAAARRAGEGAIISAEVGGKTDERHGPPVPVRGTVVRVARANFTYRGSYMTGRRVTGGWAAVLAVDGLRLVIRERRVMPFDQEELRVLGIDPVSAAILVVKSAIAWRAAYGSIARAAIEVDTPGVCTANLRTLPYRRVRRPVAPLDDEVSG
ncbi:MAG: M81 family metallopeptidase [Armatimonadota bacterium]|nr:M81 family metallopeptidase [Armatimonadota bacterium]MDR7489235.1 M81 family metallopeptidase [Armatimonadota bacterium]MDR7492086.1 M81 family metallopeptidase [Armatimonadota bacterium]MDR7528841.1 M81 family metallopeptidase [Armatimonadota bacterium]MDR7586302.1 M81 family metallopeptidase [Armatimonadota bacterium]